ncbi:MAG: NAD(P)/FAD-dependent oxidoreductase [bacterium]
MVIVGGGPAGMAAALSAAEAGGKSILLLERAPFLGGILNQCIHTGFGLEYFGKVLTGPEYAQFFIDRIGVNRQIEVSCRSFVVDLTSNKELTYLKPNGVETVRAKALIMATGCREKTREMIPISGTRPAGIFPAGLAQQLINMEGMMPGKEVVIIGSGDIGLIMARRFTLEGARVKAVIEIESTTKGLTRNVVQCLHDFDIPLYFNHKVKKIFGKDRVEKVRVMRVNADFSELPESAFDIECDTVLISVGLIPENELIEMAGVKIDRKTNTPVSSELNLTSIPGLFVCGNSYKVYDLVDKVTQDSEKAGQMAAEYLLKNK